MKRILINGEEIEIKPTPFEGKLSIEEYELQVYSSLLKIGVKEKFIKILKKGNFGVEISWIINDSNYSFSCVIYESFRENLGACVQAIREDVRHILRGIKDISLVLKQYSNSDVEIQELKKPTLSNFNSENQLETFKSGKLIEKEIKNIQIISENHAKQIINDIKLRYPNYSNYSFLPDEDRIQLEKAFIYLGRKPFWK